VGSFDGETAAAEGTVPEAEALRLIASDGDNPTGVSRRGSKAEDGAVPGVEQDVGDAPVIENADALVEGVTFAHGSESPERAKDKSTALQTWREVMSSVKE
jgi:hypothetical protein